eukprot:c10883_g3_i5.p3 GENE.c10883_g3_i5~~c10883_g3_i5.p3  ORF type:complete len:130 (+),score=33.87 c10883_g3_i5:929-1318(+)
MRYITADAAIGLEIVVKVDPHAINREFNSQRMGSTFIGPHGFMANQPHTDEFTGNVQHQTLVMTVPNMAQKRSWLNALCVVAGAMRTWLFVGHETRDTLRYLNPARFSSHGNGNGGGDANIPTTSAKEI